jgi:hypothetical protein
MNSLNLALCAHASIPPIAILCVDFDFETRNLTYVTAGQYVLTMRPDGTVQALDAGGPPLGQDSGYLYIEGTAHLGQGDLLIAYNHHLALDFNADRVLEIARDGMRAGGHAASIRDRVAAEWSNARRDRSSGTLASGLFFTTSPKPAEATLVRGRPDTTGTEYEEFWSGGHRPFQAQDHWSAAEAAH